MTHDDVFGAGFLDHRCRYFSRVSTFALPVQILRCNADVCVTRGLGNGVDGEKGRCHDNLDVSDIFDQPTKLFHEHHGFVHGFVHLPVSGDEWDSHFSLSAATPGNVQPARNSSDAPPPVEICVIRSASPALLTAAIES